MDYFQAEAGADKVLMLILEDLDVGGIMVAPLKQAGYICEMAHDAEQALEWVDKLEPDAILLDFFMQDTNGVELLKLLRQHPMTKDTPVIFMSKLPEDKAAEARQLPPVEIVEFAYDSEAILEKVKASIGEA